MKKLKTAAALLLALCMVFALTACGGEEDPIVQALDGRTFVSAYFNDIPMDEFCTTYEIDPEEVTQFWSFDGNTITVEVAGESASSTFETSEDSISFDGYDVYYSAEDDALGLATVSNGIEITMVLLPYEG